MSLLFFLHLLSSCMMTGLIWFVQVVHYPLFLRVGEAEFVAYEQQHTRRTGMVVAPLMLLELTTGIWLLGRYLAWPWAWINVGLLALIWLSTAFIQMPLHRRLSQQFSDSAARKLVRTNWLRTVAWSLRVGVLGWGVLSVGF